MRYSHPLRIIRRRKHAFKISLIFTGILILLVLVLGFTTLDASKFFLGFLESFYRVIIAYLIAASLAFALAILATSSKSVENIFVPILDALQSFPSFALFPLLLLWFGKTDIVVIIILVLEMIWPILFTLLSGQKQIKEDLIEAAHAFGASGNKYFIYVLTPLLLPSLVTGSIVAWGEAWETIIAAEILASVPGVGSYLSQSGESMHSTVLIIGIFLLLTMLFIFNKYIWLPLLNMSTKYQQE